ncbi:MAG: indole-3-glycerol phosphate synthase TrpC [Pseudobutyrivibrio sp.]|nr:indole-3-glycerol phosphate synthase TrpC [Pseudobutyrivibrio sp.]
MTILDQLAEHAKRRVEIAKKEKNIEKIMEEALALPKGNFEFEKALVKGDLAFICECKKASPSKGVIAEHFDYLQIAKDYEAAGADCISVLTEPKWFLGNDQYLKEIASVVHIPIIRKDFVVDEYMIYEAKILGASAVLLICAILSERQVADYIKICDELGISALVEIHDEIELEKAVRAGARIIGVNNRNLKDFSVDTDNSKRLRNLIPGNVTYVSESGIKDSNDINDLRDAGVDAVLIGETLMRAEDKEAKMKELKEIRPRGIA